MRTEITDPNVSNSVKSYRDIGYTFEIAIADIIDNSITAHASFGFKCTSALLGTCSPV